MADEQDPAVEAADDGFEEDEAAYEAAMERDLARPFRSMAEDESADGEADDAEGEDGGEAASGSENVNAVIADIAKRNAWGELDPAHLGVLSDEMFDRYLAHRAEHPDDAEPEPESDWSSDTAEFETMSEAEFGSYIADLMSLGSDDDIRRAR